MRDLDGGSLKLWLYIQKNQMNYEFDLSQVACEAWGLKRDSYRRAKQDLISKGYLVEVAGDGENYEFYEVPPEGVSKNELEILTAKDF